MPKPKDPIRGVLWTQRQSESHKRLYLTRKHPRFGKKLSQEAKERISKANKGKIPWNKGKKNFLGSKENHPWFGKHLGEETKRKISESQKGKIPWNKGKIGLQHHTEESRNKISQTLKSQYASGELTPRSGWHHSLEARRKISAATCGENNPNYGKSLSAECKQKLLEANLGRQISEETRRKMSQASRGREQSLETRCKRSESLMGHPVSEQTRQKISETRISKGSAARKNNPKWKGGTTSLHSLIRSSIIYKLWIKAVFTRDHFQCQDCSKIGVYLHAHHTYLFAQLLKDYNITSVGQAIRTEELWDIALGTTLCIKCHKKRHQQRSQTLEENEDLSSHWHSTGRNKAISDLERVKEISC